MKRKSKRHPKKKLPTRKLTASVRDRIRELVDILYPFVPLSSNSKKAITYRTIFRDSGVGKYLAGSDSKKPTLLYGWEKVIRYHPRLPYTLIRKIVPAAIDYRRYRRDPLRKQEISRLADCLGDLGIDMRSELDLVEINEELPEITVPPEELKKRLKAHSLVGEIAGEPLQLFNNGHFNEAVRKAAERFESVVQRRSLKTEIGKDLMAKVFRLEDPVIKLNQLMTENEKAAQEGYMFMTMGMMRAIRNIFSHGDEEQRSPEECFEMLIFINWLYRQLSSAS